MTATSTIEEQHGSRSDQGVRREIAERAELLAGRSALARRGLRLAGHGISLTNDD
jgi:hypothetical protein